MCLCFQWMLTGDTAPRFVISMDFTTRLYTVISSLTHIVVVISTGESAALTLRMTSHISTPTATGVITHHGGFSSKCLFCISGNCHNFPHVSVLNKHFYEIILPIVW